MDTSNEALTQLRPFLSTKIDIYSKGRDVGLWFFGYCSTYYNNVCDFSPCFNCGKFVVLNEYIILKLNLLYLEWFCIYLHFILNIYMIYYINSTGLKKICISFSEYRKFKYFGAELMDLEDFFFKEQKSKYKWDGKWQTLTAEERLPFVSFRCSCKATLW